MTSQGAMTCLLPGARSSCDSRKFLKQQTKLSPLSSTGAGRQINAPPPSTPNSYSTSSAGNIYWGCLEYNIKHEGFFYKGTG